ncbi:MAG: NUDIX domain-containing protein [Candidatus Hydrogenedentota bacterium]|jgi:mutator protein MutT|nr:NUDIX domain-containing protein [Candidatus Sumerlaea chitinivorans]RMH26390.1 MAG: NUDIX domain-containing protein [Candidatus Hydrogenedentota bacterium]GIX44806.1 MAG: DNA mismatch repair protein MutT [Candidatus Sumerlaea sp.]
MVTQNKPYRLSAKALILDKSGRILLVRRSARSRGNPLRWDLPGGKVEGAEPFEEALRREVLEETNVNVELVRLVGAVESESPTARIVCVVMEARALDTQVQLSAEHDEARWVRAHDLGGLEIVPYLEPIFAKYKCKPS